MADHILSIDQGTTSSRAIIFTGDGQFVADAQKEFGQIFPADGWVEHDPEEIWQTVLETCRAALEKSGLDGKDIAGIGITNQRETTVVWERVNSQPVYNAIVWQDRRTAPLCEKLRAEGREGDVEAATGLLLDPYFSGTKVKWILDNVEGARTKAEAGALAFGTIDSWLLWKLTGGMAHATDATNASRTMLFNIDKQRWDEGMLGMLSVPASLLPEVKDNAAHYGETTADFLGAPIPVLGMAGDQQSASIGQACFEPGMMKSTYGTGCFALVNTGTVRARSTARLLGTVAYRLNGETHYALEGSIFMAGATIQWLRDGLQIIKSAPESEGLAQQADPNSSVYMVPAFTGLGAPQWDAEARGAIYGMTRDTGRAEIARAALDAVCYQTQDLMIAMAQDMAEAPKALRVDGGMVANDWVCQRLADITQLVVDRPKVTETTALGAAYLASLQAGLIGSTADISAKWACDRQFTPQMGADEREKLLAGWQDAVSRTLSARPKAN